MLQALDISDPPVSTLRLEVDFKSIALREKKKRGTNRTVMTIGELSKCTGLPSSTLRYWERVKILPGAVRIHGQRRYATDAVNLIAVVKLAQRCGFSLEEIRRLIHGFKPGTSASERWRTAIREQRAILQGEIKEFNARLRLLDQGEQCQCMSLSDCGRVALKLSDSMPRQPGLSRRRAGYGE